MKSENKRLKDKAWKLFSQYIRRKYSDSLGNCSCFTCGVIKPWKELQCGHGISGRQNYVLFLEEVCRPQCYGCNVGRGGNYEIFIPKLLDTYTKRQFEIWVAESRKPMKRYKSDYLTLIAELQAQLDEYDEQESGRDEIIENIGTG